MVGSVPYYPPSTRPGVISQIPNNGTIYERLLRQLVPRFPLSVLDKKIWSALRQAPILLENQNPVESSKRKYFDQKSGVIDALVRAHNEAESWQTKRQILALFANGFSRAELQQMIPELSKWRIDQARQHVIQNSRCLFRVQAKVTSRSRQRHFSRCPGIPKSGGCGLSSRGRWCSRRMGRR